MKKEKPIGDVAKEIRLKKNLTQARAASEAEVSLYNWRTMEQGYVPKKGTFVPKVQTWVQKNIHYLKA